MPRTSPVRRLAPALAFVLAGVAIGGLLIRPADARGGPAHLRHERTAVVTRVASCNGFGFMPLSSTNGYTSNATRRTVGAAPDIHTCALSLPQAATITGVRFVVDDEAPAGRIGCALRRNHLAPPSLAAESLASDPGTTGPGTPGVTVLSDATIDTPVVNNRKFSYWAECFMDNPGVGVIGVSVTYRIAAGAG